ncbi:hypothetical protein A5845_002485, partial [Enterococcus faecium]
KSCKELFLSYKMPMEPFCSQV